MNDSNVDALPIDAVKLKVVVIGLCQNSPNCTVDPKEDAEEALCSRSIGGTNWWPENPIPKATNANVFC